MIQLRSWDKKRATVALTQVISQSNAFDSVRVHLQVERIRLCFYLILLILTLIFSSFLSCSSLSSIFLLKKLHLFIFNLVLKWVIYQNLWFDFDEWQNWRFSYPYRNFFHQHFLIKIFFKGNSHAPRAIGVHM